MIFKRFVVLLSICLGIGLSFDAQAWPSINTMLHQSAYRIMQSLQPSAWRKPTYKEFGYIGLSIGSLFLARYAWKKYNQNTLDESELIEYIKKNALLSSFDLHKLTNDRLKAENKSSTTRESKGSRNQKNPIDYTLTTQGNNVVAFDVRVYEKDTNQQERQIKQWKLTSHNSHIIKSLNTLSLAPEHTMKNEFLKLLQINSTPHPINFYLKKVGQM